MDCNEAFWFLTVGPFPSGAAIDRQVDRHLLECESCRRIAIALEPMVDQGPESLPAAQRRSLPGYRGAVGAAVRAPAPTARGQRGALYRQATRRGGAGDEASWIANLDHRALTRLTDGVEAVAHRPAPRQAEGWALGWVAITVLTAAMAAALTAIGLSL